MGDKVIDSAGFNAVVKAKYGYVLYNKNDIYIGKSIEKYGEFSDAEILLFSQICREGDVVVDVGANIGTHTLPLSQLVGKGGRVYAFEPQRLIFYALCANIALNSIENVECYQMAVSGEDGLIHMPDIRYDIRGNFGGVAVDQFSRGQKVPCIRLDTFLGVPRLNFLKVDVEGMEHGVLSGARELIETHRPVLYVENDRPEKSPALIELIDSLGYRMYWHLPPLFNPNNHAGDPEDLYPNLVSANMLCFHRSIKVNLQGFREVDDPVFHPLAQG